MPHLTVIQLDLHKRQLKFASGRMVWHNEHISTKQASWSCTVPMAVIALSSLVWSCAGWSSLSAEEDALIEGMPALGVTPAHVRADMVGAAMEEECDWHWRRMRAKGLIYKCHLCVLLSMRTVLCSF